jgi:hypothetical protein
MKRYGLTEWLVMGLLKHLLMSWFMGIMLITMGITVRFKTNYVAERFGRKKLQESDDRRVGRFAFDSSQGFGKY